MLIFSAYAQTPAAVPPGDGILSMVIQFALIMGVLYLFLVRPQQKKVKKHMAKLQAIQVGDEVLINGIIGRVVAVKGDELNVRISDNTDIKVMRLYVTDVLEKELTKKGK